MSTAGETLQRARLERGLDLASVAFLTKVNLKYLEAIEADDRASLPSAFFYKSFAHQYASVVSVATRQLDAEIDAVLNNEAPLPLPGQEMREARSLPLMKVGGYRFYKRSQFASYAALALVLLGCSGIYSWWHKSSSDKPIMAATTPAPIPPTPAPAAPPPLQVQAASVPGYKVLLELLAREETWLSVSSDGHPVFSGILAPNQSKSIEGKESAKLRVGNAAGLEVRLNGKPIGPLGGRGEVLVVVFHPDNFQIVPQPPRVSD